jgi:hypothetical protein
MLSIEELSVLVQFEKEPRTKSEVVALALGFAGSSRFDRRVALATIDSLVSIDYLSQDKRYNLSITKSGLNALKCAKNNYEELFKLLTTSN